MSELKEKAIKIYSKSDESTKKALVELFGKTTFNSVEKVDVKKLKTIEDICRVAKVKLSDILPYKKPSNEDEENTNSFVIVKLICKVLNQGWVPDFTNTNQKKWYPYFDAVSGFRFYDSYFISLTLRLRLSVPAFASKRPSWRNLRGKRSLLIMKN